MKETVECNNGGVGGIGSVKHLECLYLAWIVLVQEHSHGRF